MKAEAFGEVYLEERELDGDVQHATTEKIELLKKVLEDVNGLLRHVRLGSFARAGVQKRLASRSTAAVTTTTTSVPSPATTVRQNQRSPYTFALQRPPAPPPTPWYSTASLVDFLLELLEEPSEDETTEAPALALMSVYGRLRKFLDSFLVDQGTRVIGPLFMLLLKRLDKQQQTTYGWGDDWPWAKWVANLLLQKLGEFHYQTHVKEETDRVVASIVYLTNLVGKTLSYLDRIDLQHFTKPEVQKSVSDAFGKGYDQNPEAVILLILSLRLRLL